jgi:hypothetical protein
MFARKIPLLAAQPGDGNRTLPFEKPDHRSHRMLRRNRDAHMHMVRHQMPFHSLTATPFPFPSRKFLQYGEWLGLRWTILA